MQYTVALATYEQFPELSRDDEALLEPLRDLAINAQAVVWNKPNVDWTKYDAVILRSTWDYYVHIREFRAWLSHLEALQVRVLNPVSVVRDNLDKQYLKKLQAKGVAVVPTMWIDAGGLLDAAKTIAELPWDDLVIKPAVSAGAYRTHHVSRRELARQPQLLAEVVGDHVALVQPFLTEIQLSGEWSFVYFGCEFSHSVVKTAKAGDFRVQWRHGGTQMRVDAAPALRAEVQDIFNKLDGQRLYTRIDGVVHNGVFLLVEVEMIEPYLFLAEEPAAPKRFAKALKSILESR